MKIHLVFGLITVLLLVIVISSRQRETVGFDEVAAAALKMAQEDYLTASPALPRSLRELTADQYKLIRWNDEKTLWRKEGLPFQVRFFHPGHIYDRQIDIYEVNKQGTQKKTYSRQSFEFDPRLEGLKFFNVIGYAGFRLMYPINRPEQLDEVLRFLGGSDFQAIAKGLVLGARSRALVIDPDKKDQPPEEPVFTSFWLRRPDTFSSQFTLLALLESRSVTGAYSFEVEPGEETKVRVRARLYFRRKVDKVGFAPLISMFWFGENTSNTFGDFRPEVHKSDGLLFQTDSGEWVWRPLAWIESPQVNIFANAGPKGYGLMQRDRDFSHYQDLNSLFHQMPSVWVQPVKGFNQGAVSLLQQPTHNDQADNVMAYWSPSVSPRPLEPVEIEYVLRWMTYSPELPPLGRCVSTRVDLQDEANRREIFLDFSGGPLDKVKQGETPVPEVVSPNDAATISNVKIERNEFGKSWRVSFLAERTGDKKPIELRCRVLVNGTPASETWTYTWNP